MLRRIALFAMLSALAGCATDAQLARAEAHEYGPPPPETWKANARKWLSFELKQPESAVYRIGCPVKIYITESPLSDNGQGITFLGYGAQLLVDSVGAFGGRTGFVSYVATMNSDGTIAHIGRSLDAEGWGGPRFRVVKGQDLSCAKPS